MAFFMLYDNIRGSIKYGSDTFIPIELKKLTIVGGDIIKASHYEAVSFYMLEQLLQAFRKIAGHTSMIDLGSRKGRVIITVPYFGLMVITVLDFEKAFFQLANC